ncbi:MAG TPA: adenosine kinase [Cellvibrionaceae bacterium]
MKTYDIYGLGAALVDTEISVEDCHLGEFNIEKGVMTLVDEARQNELMQLLDGHLVKARRASGGSAANSIIAAAYFGSRCFYSCKVANDDNGDFYLSDLSRAGVAYPSLSRANAGITGKCLVLITPDAERTMNTFLGVSSTLSVDDIDDAALAAAHFAYIEGYLVTSDTGRPAAIRLRQQAEEFGVRTAFSLSDPAIVTYFHEGLTQMIGNGVDILFCNEAEAINFTRTTNLEAAFEALKLKAKTFAVTCGAKGAWVYDGQVLQLIPSQPVQAVDSNGAGDMFAGAFLHGLGQGLRYSAAAEFANRAAGLVVSQYGPRLAAEQHTQLLNDASVNAT